MSLHPCPWRQGGKVLLNVYSGDGQPVAQFHDATTAARVVLAVNALGALRGMRDNWRRIANGYPGTPDLPPPQAISADFAAGLHAGIALCAGAVDTILPGGGA